MENPTNTTVPNKPNIIMITVDQMRFPMNFPKNKGINTPDNFISTYMPKLYQYLWNPGVKFSNYYTAASDCTAARATIHTGLYAYQTYSMLTLITYPPKMTLQPDLNSAFPTIGKLMRPDYDAPYFGKWHLSYNADELEKYGYNSHTKPDDLVGYAGQGMETDGEVAKRAGDWILDPNRDPLRPFFLNVNFVNPHDKQWFWGGMQATEYNKVYSYLPNEVPPQTYTKDYLPEGHPSYNDYQGDIETAIDNWEDEDRLALQKPGAQRIIREVFQYQMGGMYEQDKSSKYTFVPEPKDFAYAPTYIYPGKHKAIAPHPFWTKALNSYLEVQNMVDNHIGEFMSRIPADVMNNTIFIFTSDHGEYGSSHGLQGKGASIYEEGILVPFVVYDPGHRMFNSTGYRNQLCSSVDLLPMIVSMGHGGTKDWMTGDYAQMYGNRCDLLSILRNPNAPGRDYAFHTTDEFVPEAANYLKTPLHVIGQITMKKDTNNNLYKQKLGVYTTWKPYVEGQPQAIVLNDPNNPHITELEFYDYRTPGGAKEMDNTSTSPEARAALQMLMGDGINEILPQLASELQRPLPATYQSAQAASYAALRWYEINANNPVILTSADENQDRLAKAWAL